MTFLDGFFHFTLNIIIPDKSVYSLKKIKLPRHSQEEPERFYTKVIALCHAYDQDIVVCSTKEDAKHGTLVVPNPINANEVQHWIKVDPIDIKELHAAIKLYPRADFSLYFYNLEKFQEFRLLNYPSTLKLYYIDRENLRQIYLNESSSQVWEFVVVGMLDTYLCIYDKKSQLKLNLHFDLLERYHGNSHVSAMRDKEILTK
jgi:uncharacterized protein YaeQ